MQKSHRLCTGHTSAELRPTISEAAIGRLKRRKLRSCRVSAEIADQRTIQCALSSLCVQLSGSTSGQDAAAPVKVKSAVSTSDRFRGSALLGYHSDPTKFEHFNEKAAGSTSHRIGSGTVSEQDCQRCAFSRCRGSKTPLAVLSARGTTGVAVMPPSKTPLLFMVQVLGRQLWGGWGHKQRVTLAQRFDPFLMITGNAGRPESARAGTNVPCRNGEHQPARYRCHVFVSPSRPPVVAAKIRYELFAQGFVTHSVGAPLASAAPYAPVAFICHCATRLAILEFSGFYRRWPGLFES